MIYNYLRFASGATPLPVYNASMASSRLADIRIFSRGWMPGLEPRPTDGLPTCPRRPALTLIFLSLPQA